MQANIEQFIVDIIKNEISSRHQLDKMKRQFCKTHKSGMLSNDLLLEVYHNMIKDQKIKKNNQLQELLTLKNTRSLSGIVVISVLTKPYDCPGKCIYCPTEKNVPKSYFSNEPAVMRAISCKYDPYLQTISRLRALDAVGHVTDKINIRIIGGTWSYYPKRYQTWFVKRVFAACNEYGNQSLQGGMTKQSIKKIATLPGNIARNDNLILLQTANETADHRIVEISVETRQDYINESEIKRLRMLGVTKVELGVQSIYDDVLLFNHRGHDNKATIKATKLLKDAGFKVSYQMMLNLPGSDLKKDFSMFQELFEKSEYKPDHLKIYPLALVRESGAYNLYKDGKFKPYTKERLITLLSKIKSTVPYYCRIERVIRDIPAEMIVEGGSKSSNLRQEVTASMTKEGLECKCIRCREIRGNFNKEMSWKLYRQDHDSADGRDIFFSIESSDRKYLFSMLRLRITSQYFSKKRHFIPVLDNSAIVREIHTYGPQVSVGRNNVLAAQHQGFGKLLVKEAEKIAKKEYNLARVAIISGVGVRGFFESLGYELKDSYMIKTLR